MKIKKILCIVLCLVLMVGALSACVPSSCKKGFHVYDNGVCTKCGAEEGPHIYDNGVCTKCGAQEGEHTYTNGVCTKCGAAEGAHHYVDGTCTKCGVAEGEHTYVNGTCTKCGVAEGAHTYENGVCTKCGAAEGPHTYQNGVCTKCGVAEGPHTYTNGVCTKCGTACTHNYQNGVCTICNMADPDAECEHVYENGVCTKCGADEPVTTCPDGEHNFVNQVCTICGAAEGPHTYVNGTCTKCGTVCTHTYVNQVCTICGAAEGEHTYVNGVCTKCGAEQECAHTYKYGICTNCNKPIPQVTMPDGGELNIFVNNQGYGTDWLVALGNKFEELFGVDVTIIPNVQDSVGTSAIGNEASTYDLAFIGTSVVSYVSAGQVQDISDVLYSIPDGETETILEKLAGNGLDDLFDFNGSYYLMPWQTVMAGIHYNVEVLDSIFGEGAWEIPVTTNEYIAMLADITRIEASKPAATRAYGITVSPELNYWTYPVESWWGQYEGYENYSNYAYGEYIENGVRKVATNAATYEKALNAQGRLEALKVLQNILTQANVNPVSEGLAFIDHQKQFASGVYQTNTNPSAFIACGDWYERETLTTVKNNGEPIRFMATPIISSLVQKLEDTTMTDATLAAVVRAFDAGATSYEGVSDADFKRIAEARQTICCAPLSHTVSIPKNARNAEVAKAFLVFMASDLGQSIFAQASGGMTQPYGYNPSNDQSISISPYVQSLIDAYKNGFKPACIDWKAPLISFGGLDIYGQQGYVDNDFWKGNKKAAAYQSGAVAYEKARYDSVKIYIAATARSEE